jgi:hypothetical protein
MKNMRQHFYWSSIILAFVCVGTGCSKPGVTMSNNPAAYVSLMNLAPYGGNIDIFFNGTQVSPSGGVAPGQFSTQYGQLKPGSYTVDFKTTGTDSLLCELPAAQFDTAKFYTLIFYNPTAGSMAVSATRIMDDLSQVTGSSSYFRFFNMSPDAMSVNLLMNGALASPNRTPADNVNNQTLEDFQAISPGNYTLQVQSVISDSVLGTQNNYPMAAGYVYTIFLTGTSKGFAVNVLPVVF